MENNILKLARKVQVARVNGLELNTRRSVIDFWNSLKVIIIKILKCRVKTWGQMRLMKLWHSQFLILMLQRNLVIQIIFATV
jgi:hypothetical protein